MSTLCMFQEDSSWVCWNLVFIFWSIFIPHPLEFLLTRKSCNNKNMLSHIYQKNIYQMNKCKGFDIPETFWGLLPCSPHPQNQLFLRELLEYTSSFILQVQWLLSTLSAKSNNNDFTFFKLS